MSLSYNHFETQVGKLGKPFKLSAVVKGKESEWIKNELCCDWYYIFKYDQGGFFGMHKDIYGITVKKLNNDEVLNLIK